MNNIKLRNAIWFKKKLFLESSILLKIICRIIFSVILAINFGESKHIPYNGESYSKRFINSTGVQNKGEYICESKECIMTASTILSNMDISVKPCDDFYKFACGRFIESTIIPNDKTSVTTFNIIDDELAKQLRSRIEENNDSMEPKVFGLVKNLYRSCMNKTEIEKQGLQPLKNILKKLGGWPVLEGDSWNSNNFEWKESVYKCRWIGYSSSYFIHFGVITDLKNSTKRVINIDQASLGLSREYLIKGMDEKIVQAYYSYMVDIAVILGANKETAKKQLKESLEFEMKLANFSFPITKRRNATKLYNPITIRKLNEKHKSIPWKEYINHLLPLSVRVDEDELVIINVPSFLVNVEKLLKETPKRVQANYVTWRVASGSVRYLNEEIRRRQLLFSTAINGRTEREPRWKECLDLVTGSLPISVGALYVRKYFKEDAKSSAVKIVTDIRKQFMKILQQVDWMDEKTRKSALEKASSMACHIAYPDELRDDAKINKFYEKLELTGNSYLEKILNLTLFNTDYAFGKLRKPVNKTDWITHGKPAVVNAFYSPIENCIQFPAGILQGAFFHKDRPRYMNYGAIGYIIGHEITHGFDDQGRQFDKDGNLVDWWEPATKDKYLKKAECIIQQYGNYTSEVKMKLNGINTQGENIADNGGIKEAYLAYLQWEKRNGEEPRLPGLKFNPHQLFWISAANIWCSKYRREFLKNRITTGVHSPGEFRVLGPFRNMVEFSRDFHCSLGTKMNPVKKCSVW